MPGTAIAYGWDGEEVPLERIEGICLTARKSNLS